MLITNGYDFSPKEYITSSIGESWWNDIPTLIRITAEMFMEVKGD